MNVIFIHNNFPAQFRHLAVALAGNPANRVIFVTRNRDVEIPGVIKVLFEPSRRARQETHYYVRQFENAVLNGQAVFRSMQQLKAAGFTPDLVYSHTGWGEAMFVKDIYPSVPLVLYCEWYAQVQNRPADFDPEHPLPINEILRHRVSNAAMLLDMEAADCGVSPTEWQRSQFPPAFRSYIDVVHDGIDTDYFSPKEQMRLVLPTLNLSGNEELVTYVARGMDSYRGFPQVMEAFALLLERRPQCHAVIVAADRIAYGPKPPENESYKAWMLSRLSIDAQRLHFVGTLPYQQYREVLRASSAHVYLTRPFVVSWSLLEAMACGCLIVASDTDPVREYIRDGENGVLVDFFDTQALARRISDVIDAGDGLCHMRSAARQTILERCALMEVLPKQIRLLERHAMHGVHE